MKSSFELALAQFGSGMWVNNPTVEEAQRAFSLGALGCTTNPTFSARMIRAGAVSRKELKQAIDQAGGHVGKAATLVQRICVGKLLPVFAARYTATDGMAGWVSLQEDPYEERNPQFIIDGARASRALGPNLLPKIPATAAGLEAMQVVLRENIPVLATEVFALSQALEAARVYHEACAESGHRPAFFITHISGIYDECIAGINKERNLGISTEALAIAGCALARRQLKRLEEVGFTGLQMGGGARAMYHFTRMVGSKSVVTLNPSTIEELVTSGWTPADEFSPEPEPALIAELRAKLPEFEQCWREDGLATDAFADFKPVRYFLGMFEKGWDQMVAAVSEACK